MTDHTKTSNTDTGVTDQQLAEYARAVAAYQTHPDIGFACCSAHPAADAAAVLLAKVRRLRDRVAELEPEADLLEALRAYGVDNWDGYDDARETAASAVSGAADSRQA